jgi:hypothetical protein
VPGEISGSKNFKMGCRFVCPMMDVDHIFDPIFGDLEYLSLATLQAILLSTRLQA